MRKTVTFALGFALASLLTVPAFADHMNARIKSVDAQANTITVIEGHKDYVFSVSPTTHFINAKGSELANGIKSGDLREGARLSIQYKKEENASLASEVKLRDVGGTAPAHANAPAPTK